MISRRLFILVLSLFAWHVTASQDKDWQLWTSFKAGFIADNGRVIDPYQNKNVTTSEGQSYALFFALVNNEPELFKQILNWTQKNLAPQGFDKQLPGWLYGKKSRNRNSRLQILDANSASDSDVWIVYSLLQAANLWGVQEYRELAKQLAENIVRKETLQHPFYGRILLPAPTGFVENSTFRLNPSYLPLQVIEAISRDLNDERWHDLLDSSFNILGASAVAGMYPDWVTIDESGNVIKREQGGYEAIRNYIWNATLHPQSHFADHMKIGLVQAAYYFNNVGYVPEIINMDNLSYSARGNVGHMASTLPLFNLVQQSALQQSLQQKLMEHDFDAKRSYYSHALALFSLGFVEKRYAFGKHGQLIVDWE